MTTAVTTTQDSPNALIALALENKADPEVLKKLMDLQERWEANQARKEYMEAMAEFKKKCPSVLKKNLKVDFTSAKGRTHYNYAGLGGIVAQITGMLSDAGLNASWQTHQDKDTVSVTCHITHSKGHRESTMLLGPMDDTGNKNRIQQIGSSVTYLQRYTLLALLGLATGEQDNDNTAGRDSIGMPVEKTSEAGHPADAAPTSTTAQGMIETVTSKNGTGKGGKPWTNYTLVINGERYGTFDAEIGKQAVELKKAGETVFIEWTQDGKYKTVTSIALCRVAPPTRPVGVDPNESVTSILDEVMTEIDKLEDDKVLLLRQKCKIDDAEMLEEVDEHRLKLLLSVVRGELSKTTEPKAKKTGKESQEELL
jgi:hypothetical protein